MAWPATLYGRHTSKTALNIFSKHILILLIKTILTMYYTVPNDCLANLQYFLQNTESKQLISNMSPTGVNTRVKPIGFVTGMITGMI